MTERKSFTRRQLRDLVFLQKGLCPECGGTINLARGETIEVDHRVALALGGSNNWSNLQAIHARCHRAKFAGDMKTISKCRRVAAKHAGSYRAPRRLIPGSKGTLFKKKIGGKTVLRSHEARV